MIRRKHHRMTEDLPQDIHDLVANIIGHAAFEWRSLKDADYLIVCHGDEALGFSPCFYRLECHPRHQPRPQRYKECLYRRSALLQELVEFFNSDWFGFLCGSVEPRMLRQSLGVPDTAQNQRRGHKSAILRGLGQNHVIAIEQTELCA